jgi:hypothetical protein
MIDNIYFDNDKQIEESIEYEMNDAQQRFEEYMADLQNELYAEMVEAGCSPKILNQFEFILKEGGIYALPFDEISS